MTLEIDRNGSTKTRSGPSKDLAGEKADKTGESKGAAGEESQQTMGEQGPMLPYLLYAVMCSDVPWPSV